MYYLLALFTGILIAVMITFNGNLTAAQGLYSATVIIHLVGLVGISALLLVKRESPFTREKRPPIHLYLGGAIGVITVLLTNSAFGNISVSALLALGLFGQSLTGILVDQFGLFGMDRHPFRRFKLAGLALMLVGIGVMVTDFGGRAAMVAAVLALASGTSIVMSRVFNARIATYIGTRRGVFFTHIVGLMVTLPLLMLLGGGEGGVYFGELLTPRFFIYIGGLLGVIVISLDNVTAVRIPAFYLALLLFVGQVSAGLVIDFILDGTANPINMIGGALVAGGLCLNVWLERRYEMSFNC
ncbi:MAG: DMT family transporter [Defluviitaleaceae bacterium]|nr:DMT family transporter [Defluviitaleaceae bacterium]MCL2274403.1 DMT family transporter [Defluviitaleaceae bacterium]